MRTRDGEQLVRFAETFGRLTKGTNAGQPINLRPWQQELLCDLAASGARRAYVQVARKNSKSMLGALVALHGLTADGEQGAEVYSVAGSREQARLVFGDAAEMVRRGPLSKDLRVLRNEILHPASGSRYKVLAAEAGLAEGLNPSLVIFDEVHVLGSDRRLWDVMNLGSGTREAPLVLGVTTPGVRYGSDGRDSLAFTLWEYGKRLQSGELVDPDFFFRCWEAPADCDLHDRAAWAQANPGLGDFLFEEDMAAAVRLTPENEFRTKRLGQWVAQQTAWLPAGSWEACSSTDRPLPGARIVLGFDGSRNRDATALIAATVEPQPFVFTVGVWERPPTARADWQVPRAEVTATVMEACRTWDVAELDADTALWLSELQDWSAAGAPVVAYPQAPSRMIPATQRFYEATVTGAMRQDGDPTLARHVGNATLRPNGQIGKETKDSGRKIDAAVAAVMAYDRAVDLGTRPPRPAVFFL